MDERVNPTSIRGIGFHSEHMVQVSYMMAFITQMPLPFLESFVIKSLAFQAKHCADTNDLLITGESAGTP